MKVLVRAPLNEKSIEELKEYFEKVVYIPWTKDGKWYEEDETLALLQKEKPDVFITEIDRIRKKVLDKCTFLQAIGVCRGNPANVDVEECRNKQIPVFCTPARNAQAVAESLVGMLICFSRNIVEAVNWEKEGLWGTGETPYYKFKGNEIYGKKVGFIGFGAIGKAAARILKAFQTDIAFYDPYVEEFEFYKKEDLDEIFSTCDIISVHLPVLDSTKKMINRDLLGKMKSNAIFVNTARSAVVDMDALLETIKEGKIKGAVLDVLDHEPPTKEDLENWNLPNVLLTPHICGASYEVVNHHSKLISEQLINWVKERN